MQRSQIREGGHYSYGLAPVFGTRLRVRVVDKGPFAKAPTAPDLPPPIPIDGTLVTGWVRSHRGAHLAVRPAGAGGPLMIVRYAELVRPWDQEVEEQRQFDAARAAAVEARQIDGARVRSLKTRLAAFHITAEFSRTLTGTTVTLTYDAAEHLVTRAERTL